jgi:lipid A disaccharide synthetase
VKSSLIKFEKNATAPAIVPSDAVIKGPVRVYHPMPKEADIAVLKLTPGRRETNAPTMTLPITVAAESIRASRPRLEIALRVMLAPTSIDTMKTNTDNAYSTTSETLDDVKP